MNAAQHALLKELARFGQENDRRAVERRDMMLNITPESGNLLSVLVQAKVPRQILEIGTSNGYSTLWLADAAQNCGAVVTTVEASAVKAAMARENFARCGLAASINLIVEDAGEFLARQSRGAYQFIFLDSDRSRYADWWPAIDQCLAPTGLLVVDNATSNPEELAPLATLMDERQVYQSTILPIGKGELVAVKRVG